MTASTLPRLRPILETLDPFRIDNVQLTIQHYVCCIEHL